MNVSCNSLRAIFGAVLIVVFSSMLAFGQQTRGTLHGVVSDELGASVVGATVTYRDPEHITPEYALQLMPQLRAALGLDHKHTPSIGTERSTR